MRRTALARAVGALTLAAGAAVLPAGPAAAASSSDPEDRIVRYHLDVDLDADGDAQVTLDLDVDFGQDPNRGPYLTYLVKQRFDGGERPQDRVYRIENVRATSSTGAATEVHVEESGAQLVIRIGEEDRDDFRGVHSYRVTYRVEGWVNSASSFSGLSQDELYLNVIGNGWEIPLQDVQVTVTAPDDVVEAECFAVRGDEPCSSAQTDGATAVFTQDALDAREPLTVRTRYPAGTFGDVEPILQDRWTFSRAFALTPWTALLTVLVAAGGVGRVVAKARTVGRDEQFLGLTPGLTPAPGQDDAVGPRRAGPVAVQFTPPAGLRPGELGTLVDERADPHDVTATLVDLAVREYLRIEQQPSDDEDDTLDWRLVRQHWADDSALLAFEATLLEELFADDGQATTLSDLRTTFAASMAKVQTGLYTEVTEKGWFRSDPQKARSTWLAGGVGLIVLGVLLTAGLALATTWGLVGLAVVLVGIVATSLSGRAPARTAAGTAVLAQAEGFRTYLATAEAEQLRFEEGQDLFSRYLPFAIAFGLTERWAKLFADLAAQGRALPEPTWYVGPAYGQGLFWANAGAFSSDLTSFTQVADDALTAPTPGSSGSGGSGFSGGGVSGGGGGTW